MKTVCCPQCGKPTSFTPENEFRPFCSDRCRLIDLGQWADENYRISEQISNVNENQKNSDDPSKDEGDFDEN